MKFLRRRRGTRDEQSVTGEVEGGLPVASAGQMVTDGLTVKLLHGLLLLCVVLGPVGAALGGVAWATRRAPSAVAAQSVTQDAPERAIAGMFAAEVVTAWLTASVTKADRALALLPALQISDLPSTPLKVSDVMVGQILTVGGGVFTVTVGATVTDATKATARRHFQVPVQVDDGRVAALALPALIAPPVPAMPAGSGYSTRLDTSSEPVTAAAEFLTAMLTGQGEVSRYVSPGVAIEPLTPAPFKAIKVSDAESVTIPPEPAVEGDRLQVQVTITGAVADQQEITCTYWLTLAARGGRWEIASIDTQPAASPTDSRRSPTPGPTR